MIASRIPPMNHSLYPRPSISVRWTGSMARARYFELMARAAHAAQPSSVMNARRLIGLPGAKDHGLSIAGQGRASQQTTATHFRFGSNSTELAEPIPPFM